MRSLYLSTLHEFWASMDITWVRISGVHGNYSNYSIPYDPAIWSFGIHTIGEFSSPDKLRQVGEILNWLPFVLLNRLCIKRSTSNFLSSANLAVAIIGKSISIQWEIAGVISQIISINRSDSFGLPGEYSDRKTSTRENFTREALLRKLHRMFVKKIDFEVELNLEHNLESSLKSKLAAWSANRSNS